MRRPLSDSPGARRRREKLAQEKRSAAVRLQGLPFGHSWPADLTGAVHDPADCTGACAGPGRRVCIHIPKAQAPDAGEVERAWFRLRKAFPDRDARLQGGAGEKTVVFCHDHKGLYSATTVGRGWTWDEAIDNAIALVKARRGGP